MAKILSPTGSCPLEEPGPAQVNRGRQVSVTVDHGTLPVELMTYRADEYGPQLVQLYIHDEVDLAADTHGEPLVDIVWGAGGVQQSATVDVANGCSLVLVAQTISLVARFQQDDADHWPSAVIGAVVHPCHGAQQNKATRSFPHTAIANLAAATFAIPRYARGLIVNADDPAAYAATSDLTFHSGDDGTALELLEVNLATNTTGFANTATRTEGAGGIFIPPNAKSVVVANATGAGRSYGLVFILRF